MKIFLFGYLKGKSVLKTGINACLESRSRWSEIMFICSYWEL